MEPEHYLDQAHSILRDSVIYFNGLPAGTVAALDTSTVRANYEQCFVRDFVPSALCFLFAGRYDIVASFLRIVLDIRIQQKVMEGHERAPGLMPASFRIEHEDGRDRIIADFGERAIGRVAPVDSAMWWIILLHLYTEVSADRSLVEDPGIQDGIHQILKLYLRESFETSPSMLVPDGAFMVDRRMGVYGHPLEIQSLFFGTLLCTWKLLPATPENAAIRAQVKKRMQTLRSYIRIYYWLDVGRLNEIHRYKGEEFGVEAKNLFNIYPETIPDWMDGWLQPDTGFFIGNLGPGRIDFRYFSMGNLLAIIFGLATEQQARDIMTLHEQHWDELVGEMPMKICYPAMSGHEWALATGSDPKNAPWSYHNGGSWPALLWAFTAACVRTGRQDLGQRILDSTGERLQADNWPEYYDGKRGSLIGRRANLQQVWSATSILVSDQLLKTGDKHALYQALSLANTGLNRPL